MGLFDLHIDRNLGSSLKIHAIIQRKGACSILDTGRLTAAFVLFAARSFSRYLF
jgi:hypothetical protein